MKTSLRLRSFTALSTLALAGAANAQTINLEDMTPEFGSTVHQVIGSVVPPGSSGPNQTWDLSAMGSGQSNTTTVMNPSGLPNASLFPTATHAMAGSESGETGFMRLADNKIEILGLSFPNYVQTYEDPRSQLEFPLFYEGTFTDTYHAVVDLGDGVVNHEVGSTSTVVDGYGTLTTPAGNYTDVLRLKQETTSLLYLLLFGDTLSVEPVTSTTYIFLKAGYPASMASLMTMYVFGETTEIATYLTTGTVGLERHNPIRELSVYPVPATDRLTVRLNMETPAEIRFHLYGLDGRRIATLKGASVAQGERTFTLELPDGLAGGMYLIQVQSPDFVETRKISVR